MTNATLVYHMHVPSTTWLIFWSILLPSFLILLYLILFYYAAANRRDPKKVTNSLAAAIILAIMSWVLRTTANLIIDSQMVLATEFPSDYLGTLLSVVGYGSMIWDAVLYPIFLAPFIIIWIFMQATRRAIRRR